MRNQLTNALEYSLPIALWLIASASFSLETDKEQDVQWNADSAVTNIEGDIRNLNLTGNVKVTQGTIIITGNQAVFEYRNSTGELQRVTVLGSPADYQQQLDVEGNIFMGTSETMLFYTDTLDGETVLELIGNAEIESPDSTMRCEQITYLADRALIREATVCEGVLSTQPN